MSYFGPFEPSRVFPIPLTQLEKDLIIELFNRGIVTCQHYLMYTYTPILLLLTKPLPDTPLYVKLKTATNEDLFEDNCFQQLMLMCNNSKSCVDASCVGNFNRMRLISFDVEFTNTQYKVRYTCGETYANEIMNFDHSDVQILAELIANNLRISAKNE